MTLRWRPGDGAVTVRWRPGDSEVTLFGDEKIKNPVEFLAIINENPVQASSIKFGSGDGGAATVWRRCGDGVVTAGRRCTDGAVTVQ